MIPLKAERRPHDETVERAVRQRLLEPVYADRASRIYQLRNWDAGGSWTGALISGEARELTFAGLSREPLELASPAGALTAEVADVHWASVTNLTRIRVDNRSAQTWPGFDLQHEGLVLLRYTYRRLGGDRTTTRFAALDFDFPARTTTSALAFLRSAFEPGRYALCLDLVQQVGDQHRALPVAPFETTVSIRQPRDETGMAALMAAAYKRSAEPAPCGTRD